MKCEMAKAMILAIVLLAVPAVGEDRTITQVVKLLESMLEKSKADGDEDRSLFGKHKCYCDDNEAQKKDQISQLTDTISFLESDIEGLLSSTATLSKDVEKLQADINGNALATSTAISIRGQENTAFVALETDLDAAITQMGQAIDNLAEIGSDQTLAQAAADHTKFMGAYSNPALLKLKATVHQALLAASAVVTKKQSSKVEAFLQAPFTATYTAQSGEVVGILKDMRDTFSSNLDNARKAEAAAVDAHTKYLAAMQSAAGNMQGSYMSKQGNLATNDGTLGSKRNQLTVAETEKTAAQTFLESLLEMCRVKAQQYEKRTLLRTNEEAAIAEAISILNSDAAFETFGTVSATKTGATGPDFFQRASVHRHLQGLMAHGDLRQKAQSVLRKAAGGRSSLHLSKIAALLEANNPFSIVLKEIQKMIALIGEEETADTNQKTWCDSERLTNNQVHGEKVLEITTLTGTIEELTHAIENPADGLKALISIVEDNLALNMENQKTETKERTDENVAYQKDVENLVEAEDLLGKAITVLQRYYNKILNNENALLAVSSRSSKEEPAPPATWQGEYNGQTGHGGTDAISMLKFILQNTQQEQETAHDSERIAQQAYEDSMSGLKTGEQGLRQSLAATQLTLATTEKDLLNTQDDLKATEAAKGAIEAYLLKIKPGCDFITNNIDTRRDHRITEKAALETATGLLMQTPAYQEAMALGHNETLGDCLGICAGNEEHVDCKACRAHVTVPGYCAGHETTVGC